ncbi:MAG: hypothetical protein ACQESH_03280 [Campylobacterota bacterium]
MKKTIATLLLSCALLQADSEVMLSHGVKDYSNSKTKVEGKVTTLRALHSVKNATIGLGFQKDTVDRQNPKTKASMQALEVKKYNLHYRHKIAQKYNIGASFITIDDNLAPTDAGKIYGLGGNYAFSKRFKVGAQYYRSDYKHFDVNQFDIFVQKGFKLNQVGISTQIITKAIQIDGQRYGEYSFEEKDYLSVGLKLGAKYKGYKGGVATFIGKRAFGVFDGGQVVQHHAMEQGRTYMASLAKEFKDFEVALKYSYQNGKELPEDQSDVDTVVTMLELRYGF